MKKQTSKRRGTVVLSGFGAALSLVAGNLAVNAAHAETIARPTLSAASSVKPLAQAARIKSLITYDKATLCKIKNTSCLMGKSYVKKLSAAEKRKLRVLIGLGVQTDIKDACLHC